MHNLENSAIRFGETVDQGFSDESVAFPYMYTLVSSASDTYQDSAGGNPLRGMPFVAANSVLEVPVVLDPDFMFALQFIKYTISGYDAQGAGVEWVDYDAVMGDGSLAYDYQGHITTPYTNILRVSVSFHGPDGRYLYGGKNLDNNINGLGDLLGIRPATIQGYPYGPGQIRTAFLLPRQGIIKFRFENTPFRLNASNDLSKDVYVDALIYGFKVRL